MKKVVLSILYPFVFLTAFSQFPILDDTIRVRGLYKSFNEFLDNNPSHRFNFSVSEKSTGYGNFGSEGKLLQYEVEVEKEHKRELDNIWGFCDGQYVYRHDINNTWYHVYSVIHDLETYPNYNVMQYSFNNGSNSIALIIIDIEKGLEKKLTFSKLKKTLKKNDPELYDRYCIEVYKKEKQGDYYVKFRKKNPNFEF